jgi:hypothetical protein
VNPEIESDIKIGGLSSSHICIPFNMLEFSHTSDLSKHPLAVKIFRVLEQKILFLTNFALMGPDMIGSSKRAYFT